MLKRKLYETLLTLFLLVVLTFAFKIGPVWAYDTIYIRDDGSVDPPTPLIVRVDDASYCFTGNIDASIVVEKDHIVIDGSGYTVQGPKTYGSIGLDLSERVNVTISNMTVASFWFGIYLNHSFSNAISGNIITNNTYIGTYAQYSPNNRFFGNNATANNGLAFFLQSCDNSTVEENRVIANGANGIMIRDSSDCTIKKNFFMNNDLAIDSVNSYYVQISKNTIVNNTNYGIRMEDFSSHNLVADNNLTNNGEAIWTHATGSHMIIRNTIAQNARGFALHGQPGGYNTVLYNNVVNNTVGVYLWETYFNQFVGNNFVDNEVQVLSEDSVSIWSDSYLFGGNYWSDYNGTDWNCGPFQNETGNDGIGDVQYVIDVSNIDNYPLMGAFSVFNATSECQVEIVSNSSVSDFAFDGTAIRFNVFGQDGTTGFCRVRLQTDLMNGSYRVTINGTETSYRLLPYSGDTHDCLYFTYGHSKQEVVIIPEFSSFLILPLFMVGTLLAVIAYKRKQAR